MALLMLDIGGSALQVALLFAFRWTPMLLFALVSGMVADRANRRVVMIVARGVAVAVTAILLVLVASNQARPEHLFVGSLLLGWLYVLEFPSRRSFIYELVGGRQVVGAMSLETISTTIGRLLGPLAAGVLVGQAGFTVAFATLVGLYSLAFLFVLLGADAAASAVKRPLQPVGYGENRLRIRLQEPGGAGRAHGHHYLQRSGL